MDMIRLRMSAAPPTLINPDLRGRLAALARSIAVPYLFERLDHVAEAIRVTQGGANLNLQLLLEDLLIPWGAASQ